MILNNKKWVTFFSHTGSEIYNLSKAIGRFPDLVITNNGDPQSINRKLRDNVSVTVMSDRPSVSQYRDMIGDTESVVTLHGWMRIIPESICKMYEIYNLHPGLITHYPELKGADPQKKVAEEVDESRYKKVGCVIHKVTPEVDEGEIVASCSTCNHFAGVGTLTEQLHNMACELWVDLIKVRVADKQAS